MRWSNRAQVQVPLFINDRLTYNTLEGEKSVMALIDFKNNHKLDIEFISSKEKKNGIKRVYNLENIYISKKIDP